MLRSLCVFVIASTASTGALAANPTLATGPAPAWVKPVVPASAPATPGKAPIQVLLQDQQVDLRPGSVSRYSENVIRIQTPQGLSAGNVLLAWNPDTQTPMVHKLLIRRGDKVIDVLANQTFTVVRRETNIENAALDGVLTAALQPEGLQVGDEIDFAATITEHDPAVGKHVEEVGGGWNGVPVGRAHLLVRWPSDLKMRFRDTPGLPPLKVTRKGNLSSTELLLNDLPVLAPPSGAPPRYAIMRIAEFSDLSSWGDLADLLQPLYEKASALPAEASLRKQIADIAARSADPQARAEAALKLVQDRVRYVFLGMNDGGLVPADAETTWQRRFGDCKGKTVLLLALLKGLGIKAEPVLVSSSHGDGIDQRLPMISLFDHVLVRATIADRTYWLDGTRTGDTSLDQIKTPDFRWGLPLIPDATLVAMDAPAATQPQTEATIRIDASAGITLPAPFHAEKVIHDDAAALMNQQLSGMTSDVLDRSLREFWRGEYDFVTIKTVSASFDPATRQEHLVMDGDAKMDWNSGWYDTDGVGVGYKADFTRDPGTEEDAPFAVAYPYSDKTIETILLPPGKFTIYHGAAVDQTVAGIDYHRTATLSGNRFTVEEDEHSTRREFPAADAPAAQTVLRALSDQEVYLGKPDDYRPTDREMATMMQTEPTTAEGFVDRGNALLDRARLDEAIKDFTGAIALDPKNAWAFADRGLARLEQSAAVSRSGDMAAAEKDFAAAETIDPKNPVVWRGRGLAADLGGDAAAAVKAYTQSLVFDPNSTFALSRRAAGYHKLGDEVHALADADAALRIDPSFTRLYLLRANAYRAAGDSEKALEQAALLRSGSSPFERVAAARIYADYGHWSDAAAQFEAALKILPVAWIYINRSEARPKNDLVGRQTDLDAAAKIEAKSTALFAAQAQLDEDRSDYAAAVERWNASLALAGDDAYALVRRGIDQQRLGKAAAAAADFTAAHSLARNAEMLSMICHEKAVAGLALDLALAECRAARDVHPERPDFQEAFGLTELRLNQMTEAAAAFDKASAEAPKQPSVAYGLAVIEIRRGDVAKGKADSQAALAADPAAAADFGGLID